MKTPRVSVIMPFFNAQAHLAEAVDSVLAQSFGGWELLLVDDGSSDASEAMAREYEARVPCITVLRSNAAQRGAAAARNTGISAAQGEFIAFLDSDDLYDPEKLASDVAALDSDPQAAWLFGATRWFFDGEDRRDRLDRLGVPLDRHYSPPYILNRIILEQRGDVPCTCGVMIRKSALTMVGGFEERFALYEDQSLWVKLLLAFPVRVASGCHAAYRQHAASTSSAAAASGTYSQTASHPARNAFLNWVEDYAAERDAPRSVFRSLTRAKAANDGHILPRLARAIRIMGRFVH